jgi:hypothetical protein
VRRAPRPRVRGLPSGGGAVASVEEDHGDRGFGVVEAADVGVESADAGVDGFWARTLGPILLDIPSQWPLAPTHRELDPEELQVAYLLADARDARYPGRRGKFIAAARRF